MRKTIHYIDMFAGMGGFREGLTRAGNFVCMGHCEIDKYADRSYRALFDTEGEWFIDDARKADPDTMPDFELLCGGFPCQAFSLAGNRRGFGDPRGTLFFELARLAEAGSLAICCLKTYPACFLMRADGRLRRSSIRWTDWGMVWNGRCSTARISAFPSPAAGCILSDILMSDVEEKYFLSPQQQEMLLHTVRPGAQGERIYSPDGISCTLAAHARAISESHRFVCCRIAHQRSDPKRLQDGL